MNEEEGFHKLLDENIEDHLTRTILADFLQDKEDSRASGYRELGQCEIYPTETTIKNVGFALKFKGNLWCWKRAKYTTDSIYSYRRYGETILPIDLWNLLSNYVIKVRNTVYYSSRRDAEDAFARAFAIYQKPMVP